MDKFWAVASEKQSQRGGGVYYQFSHRHPTAESAKRDAERLASNNRGVNFMVLELIGHAGPVQAPVGWTTAINTGDAESPF